VRLVTVPGVGANDLPSNLYGVVINDEDGVDVLMGAGATRSNVLTQQVLASSLGVFSNDILTILVTGAGASKRGTVYLYIK
jgi:hypothetical protein